MPAPYDYDLRTKAIEAVKRGEKKLHVAQMLNISRNTLDLWLNREKDTGDYRAIAKKGRPRKIKNEEKFRQFIMENKDKTQQQMAQLWGDNITQQNISYFCQKIGITRKKKTYGYEERDEEERQKFREKLSKVEKNKLVYVDEAGFDNRDDYPYGYSPKGEKCLGLKSGKKRERTSWIGALREKKLFAPLTFEGSCNRYLFEYWLEYCLIPQLNIGDIII